MVVLHDVNDDVSESLLFRQTQCDTGPCRLLFRLSERLVEVSKVDASETGSHQDAPRFSLVTTINNFFLRPRTFTVDCSFRNNRPHITLQPQTCDNRSRDHATDDLGHNWPHDQLTTFKITSK